MSMNIHESLLDLAITSPGEERISLLDEIWAASGGTLSQDILNGALYRATDNRKEVAVSWLLDKGADANTKGDVYGTALTVSARDGSLGIAKSLLGKGADVNAEDGFALQMAAKNGHSELVFLLIENGADPNRLVPTRDTFTEGSAIHAACIGNHSETVRVLLQNGANPNVGSGTLGRPVFGAIPHANMEALSMLTEGNLATSTEILNLNVSDGPEGLTPLMYSVSMMATSALGHLLKAGAAVECESQIGDTALIMAASMGNATHVEYLLESGADVMHASRTKTLPIEAAISNGHVNCARILLPRMRPILHDLGAVVDLGAWLAQILEKDGTDVGFEQDRDSQYPGAGYFPDLNKLRGDISGLINSNKRLFSRLGHAEKTWQKNAKQYENALARANAEIASLREDRGRALAKLSTIKAVLSEESSAPFLASHSEIKVSPLAIRKNSGKSTILVQSLAPGYSPTARSDTASLHGSDQDIHELPQRNNSAPNRLSSVIVEPTHQIHQETVNESPSAISGDVNTSPSPGRFNQLNANATKRKQSRTSNTFDGNNSESPSFRPSSSSERLVPPSQTGASSTTSTEHPPNLYRYHSADDIGIYQAHPQTSSDTLPLPGANPHDSAVTLPLQSHGSYDLGGLRNIDDYGHTEGKKSNRFSTAAMKSALDASKAGMKSAYDSQMSGMKTVYDSSSKGMKSVLDTSKGGMKTAFDIPKPKLPSFGKRS